MFGNNKQRRKSDPPLSTIQNKENKRPNRIHGSTPSLNVPNKPIRKPSSVRSSKVKPAKHNGSIKMDSKVLPQIKDDNLQRFGSISSIDEADNEQEPVTVSEGEEVEIVDVRGVEYERDIDTSTSDSELSDRAEEIVAKILDTRDGQSERYSIQLGAYNRLVYVHVNEVSTIDTKYFKKISACTCASIVTHTCTCTVANNCKSHSVKHFDF